MAKMEKMPVPTSMTSYKKAVREVAKAVASRLGHTPTVSLQSYINPAVFTKWKAAL
jgi:DNA topoisomerase IB